MQADAFLQADSGRAVHPDQKLNCKSLAPRLSLATNSFCIFVIEDAWVLLKAEQVEWKQVEMKMATVSESVDGRLWVTPTGWKCTSTEDGWGVLGHLNSLFSVCSQARFLAYLCACTKPFCVLWGPTNSLGNLGDAQRTVQVHKSENTIALVFIEFLEWTDLFFGLVKSWKKIFKCDTVAVWQSKKIIIWIRVFQYKYPKIIVAWQMSWWSDHRWVCTSHSKGALAWLMLTVLGAT